MNNIETKRQSYAIAITSMAQVKDVRVTKAFASVPRELFLTSIINPALIYEDILVPLYPEKGINNGQPSLHALCIDKAAIQPGEKILHIGCGSGYYSAILAELTTSTGSVVAWDIETSLATAAANNLAQWLNVRVACRSGTEAPIPKSDFIYISAGCSQPLQIWLDALSDNGGRLIFPLTPGAKAGDMLKITKYNDTYKAQFFCPCRFIPCSGTHNIEMESRLVAAYARGDRDRVCALYLNVAINPKICWVAGDNWWLGTK